MLGLNSNLPLGMQGALNRTQSAFEASQQHMASGLRINSAAEDAAGLALATQFASQILENNQGIRNLNDGVSLVQTAEGGVSEISNAVQRIRELSVQSANATLSDSDRAIIQKEVSVLQEGIGQAVESTTFNGKPLLGNNDSLALQGGSGDTIPVATSDVMDQLKTLGFDAIDLSTAEGASSALEILDQTGSYLSEVRGGFGAMQNRLESSMRNLATSGINAAAAQSRIQDTDYAQESAAQARDQILMQANLAMQSQANRASADYVSRLLQVTA